MGSLCLGGRNLKPPGSLEVTNFGGQFSSWIKQLGGANDPRYVHMAMVER